MANYSDRIYSSGFMLIVRDKSKYNNDGWRMSDPNFKFVYIQSCNWCCGYSYPGSLRPGSNRNQIMGWNTNKQYPTDRVGSQQCYKIVDSEQFAGQQYLTFSYIRFSKLNNKATISQQ